MAGKHLMNGLLVLAIVGALVYLVDPTMFGLLRHSSGFANMEEKKEENFVEKEEFGDKDEKEGFASNGTASPGQMSNPGAVNLANQLGNAHGMGGDMGAGAQGFQDLGEGPANFGTTGAPAGCYPRDQLTPSELLPKDQNSVWAEQNPMGPGSLKGKNFLSAGALIGVNTVGQSLRNANWQLRSEPPNPQVPISIFNQSTIAPDTNRRPLEIN
jgi:hypothetical protein